MTIGVTFEEDDTKLGREICFCYFYHLGSINEIELAIWIINFTNQHDYNYFSFNLVLYCQFVFNLPLNIVKLLFYHMRNEIYTCSDGIIKDNYMSDTKYSTNIKKKKNKQLSSQITEQKPWKSRLCLLSGAITGLHWQVKHNHVLIIGPPMLTNYDKPAQISYHSHISHTRTKK